MSSPSREVRQLRLFIQKLNSITIAVENDDVLISAIDWSIIEDEFESHISAINSELIIAFPPDDDDHEPDLMADEDFDAIVHEYDEP